MSNLDNEAADHDAEPPRIKLMAFVQRALLGESTSDYQIDWPNWRWLLLPLGLIVGYGVALLAPIGDHALRPLSYLTKDALLRDSASGDGQVIGALARGDTLVGLKPAMNGWRKLRGRQAFVEAASVSHLRRPDLDTTVAGAWIANASGEAPGDVDDRIKVPFSKGEYPVVGRVKDGPMKGRLEVMLKAGVAYLEERSLARRKAAVVDRRPPAPTPPSAPVVVEKTPPVPEVPSPAPPEPVKPPPPDPVPPPKVEPEDRTPGPKSEDFHGGKVPGRLAIKNPDLRPGAIKIRLNCRVKFRKAEWEKFGDGLVNCRDPSNSRIWALYKDRISAFVLDEYRLTRGPYTRGQTVTIDVQIEIVSKSKEAGSR